MHYLRLEPERSVLALIDIQERLAGAMNAEEQKRCLANAIRLASGAAKLGVPVVVTEQYPKGLGPTVAELATAVSAIPGVTRVEKTAFDACDIPAFTDIVGGKRDHIVVAGMEAHICVFQTVRGLRARGRAVHVVKDATCSRDVDNRRIAETLWRDLGAQVTTTETVLFDWLRDAAHPAFREIAQLVK